MDQDVREDLMPAEGDLLYEEELLRNPTALRLWIKYIEARHEAPAKKRFLLYERAIQKLPGSYKVCMTIIIVLMCKLIPGIGRSVAPMVCCSYGTSTCKREPGRRLA